MFESDPAKKAAARLAKYEAQKAKRIEEAEKPKDPKKTFGKIVGIMAALGAASNENVRATGAAVFDGLAKGVGGRELLVDLPPQLVQSDMPPSSAEEDAKVAKLETAGKPSGSVGSK